MLDKLITSPLMWITLTVGLYLLAARLKAKWPKNPLFTPLVFAIIMVILILLVTGTPLETYNAGGQFIGLFVTPATVALAIKLEKKFCLLKTILLSNLNGNLLGGYLAYDYDLHLWLHFPI